MKLFSIIIIVFGGLTSNLLLQKSYNKVSSESMIANTQKAREKSVVSSSDKRQWIPPTYLGLKFGKSTVKDVKRIFGKPEWEGPPEGAPEDNSFSEDSEDEILLQYANVGEAKDYLDITVGKKSKVVKAIAVYSNSRPTKQEIISEYGLDFFEIESWEPMCIEKERQPGESHKKMKYPIALVYPNKGMYVSIQSDNRVNHIGYLVKCTD